MLLRFFPLPCSSCSKSGRRWSQGCRIALTKQSEPAVDKGCRVCTDILTGLSNMGGSVQGYDAPNPPDQVHAATGAEFKVKKPGV